MRKKFTFLIAAMALFVAMVVPQTTWGQDNETLSLENLGANLSGTSNTTMATTDITATGTSDTYTINYLQGKKQGNAILLAKSTGAFISNHTPIPGDIVSVTVFINSGAAGKTTYYCGFSTTECTEALVQGTAVNITGGNNHTYTCSVPGARYFCVSLGNANNGQVLSFDVTYSTGGGSSATLQSIAVSGTAEDLWTADAFTHNGITVTANWSDNSQTDVTNACTYSGYDMTTAGNQTVTVTYQEKQAQYNVTVNTIANTQATAYTVAEAKAIIDDGKGLNEPVYVKGIITRLDASNNAPQYKNLTYWISDDGTTENEFEAFRGRGLNNSDFTTNDDLTIGYNVVIYGTVVLYGEDTYEFTAGNYLVSYVAPSADTYTITVNPTTNGTVTASKDETIAGDNVTLTITPANHYYLSNLSVTGNESGDPVTVTNNQFTMPAENVTVSATFTAKTLYTVTYMSLGSQIGSEQVYDGETCTDVPSPSFVPDGWNLFGWTTGSANVTTTAPTMFNTTTPITSNITLNAVFTHSEGSSDATWTETALADLTSEDVFVIVGANNKLLQNNSTTAVSVTIENQAVTTTIINDEYKWNVTHETNGYIFNANNGTNVLYFTNNNNGVKFGTPVTGNEGTKYFSQSSDDYLVGADGTNTRYLSYYETNNDWRCYKNTDNNPIAMHFYKLIQGTVYYTTVTPVIQNYTVEIDNTIDNGTVEADVDEAMAGATITLTVTPDAHYTLKANSLVVLEQTSADEVTITDAGNGTYTFTMPADDVLVSAEFEAVPTYTYMYSINGTVEEPTIVDQTNNVITLAAGTDLDEDFKFAGWSLDENDFTNLKAANSNLTLTDNATIYAVYKRTTSSRVNEYQKVTDATDLTIGCHVVIAAAPIENEDAVAMSTTQNKNNRGQATILRADDVITWDGNDVCVFELKEGNKANTWAFFDAGYNENTGGYLCAASSSSNLLHTDATLDKEGSWTIEISEETTSIIAQGDYTRNFMQYNAGSDIFSCYSGASQTNVELYMVASSSVFVTEYFTRVFLGIVAADGDIEITGPSIIPAYSILNMLANYEYTLTCSNRDKLIIEEGAQLIHGDAGVAATMKRNISGYGNEEGHYYFISEPFLMGLDIEYTDQYGGTNLTSGEEYDLYYYNEPTAYWLNQKDETSGFEAMGRCMGYLYANKDDMTLTFAGDGLCSVKDDLGQIVTLQNNVLKGFNLIGNSYACNATIAFESDNPDFYYVMNAEGNDYETVEGDTPIAPLSAVFVQASEDDEAVYLFPETEYNSKGNTSNAVINLSVSKNERSAKVINNAMVRLSQGHNIDKFMLNNANTRISILNNGKEFGGFCAENENALDIAFKAAQNGQYTINVAVSNADLNYLHLIDNLTGNDVDLLENNSYTFDAKTSDYTSRFKLIFQEKNIEENVVGNENFAIFADGNLIIQHEGTNTLQVVDLLGHILSTETFNGSYNKAVNLSAGVYMLRMTTENSTNCQKIVVR